MWSAIARFILRYRLAIILALAGSTAFMLYNAQNVRLYYGLPRMLPDDDKVLVTYDTFKERFKTESTVFVIGVEKDLFSDLELFNEWYKLGRELSKIDGVDTVLSVCSAFNIVKDTANKRFDVLPLVTGPAKSQSELDSLRMVYDRLPFYKQLLADSASNANLMAISMDNNRFNSPERSEFFDLVLAKVKEFDEQHHFDIKYSGLAFIREKMTNLIKSELRINIILALIVTILILYFFFRSVKPVLVAMAVVGLGVIWSLGIIALLDYEITILTSLIPPLIIVIGIPNCIYLINMFHSELKKHGNKTKALVRVVSKIGKATFMTNATTATGFLTFIFTQSIILVEFGIVAFINIMVLFMISLLVITITFSYLQPPKDSLTDHLDKNWITNLIAWFIRLVSDHRKAVYITTVSLVGVACYGLSLVVSTGNIVDDLPQDHDIVTDLHWVESKFGGVVPFEVQVDTKKPKGAIKSSTLKQIDQTQEMFAEYDILSRSISIVDALKFIRQAFYNGNPDRYDLISSREKAFYKEYIENAEKDNALLDDYIDSNQRYARISLSIADVGTIEMNRLVKELEPRVDSIFNPRRAKLYEQLNAIENAHPEAVDSLLSAFVKRNTTQRKIALRMLTEGDSAKSASTEDLLKTENALALLKDATEQSMTEVLFTGPSVTFLAGSAYLVKNLFVSLSLAILIVALIMAAVFSSLRMIAVSVVTNLIPLLFTAAIMGFFGIAIKPSTILVFSIAFGISVDDTIHFLSKYRLELKHKMDIGIAVRNALRETGVSMVYTSIILFFGFSVFGTSEFGGTKALGVLVSLTLLVAMFANLILLPSFLMSFERLMVTKSFQEPLLEILDEEEDIELDELEIKGDQSTTDTE